jgi:hypothetical protein
MKKTNLPFHWQIKRLGDVFEIRRKDDVFRQWNGRTDN